MCFLKTRCETKKTKNNVSFQNDFLAGYLIHQIKFKAANDIANCYRVSKMSSIWQENNR